MEPGFWHERWQKGEINFHLPHVNPQLTAGWPRLALPADTPVFVPLCGKSLDLLWLREQGHPVIGVELSPIAVAHFFAEQQATPTVTNRGPFRAHTCDGITLLEGDYFALTPDLLWPADPPATAIYDRAALVALPPAMRVQYARKLCELACPGTRMLLITLEYPQERRAGPPFSVPPAEVATLFAEAAEIDQWLDADVLADHPRWQANGIPYLREHAYCLTFR